CTGPTSAKYSTSAPSSAFQVLGPIAALSCTCNTPALSIASEQSARADHSSKQRIEKKPLHVSAPLASPHHADEVSPAGSPVIPTSSSFADVQSAHVLAPLAPPEMVPVHVPSVWVSPFSSRLMVASGVVLRFAALLNALVLPSVRYHGPC